MTLAPQPAGKGYDPHKLAIAISCAETSCGKDGTAVHRKNCCGIMTWKTGQRQPKYFARYEDSLNEAAAIWNRSYKRFPDVALATKWTGNDHPDDWLATVNKVYYSL